MRHYSIIPACYFPTTVVMIDDDRAYLNNLRSILSGKQAAYHLFDKPKMALSFLNDEYQARPFVQRIINRAPDNERGHYSLEVNVSRIRDEAFNVDRFKQISMIIIDQEMPGLKGLDLCRALKNIGPIRKLMLTGAFDDKQAIQAFNEGVINQFVNKKDADIGKRVNEFLINVQKRYFSELSEIVVESLVRDPGRNGLCCLTDPLFIEFFTEFCAKHHVIEYYLLDTSGSFMFLDFKGKPSFLVVQNKEDMRTICDNAKRSENPPANEVLKQMAAQQIMLYIHNEEDRYTQPKNWQEKGFLHPVSELKGTYQNYYYSYVSDVKNYAVDTGRILSFYKYLESGE